MAGRIILSPLETPSEATISTETQNAAQNTVNEVVHETIINQPIVQPFIIQQTQPAFEFKGIIPTVFPEEISKAEQIINKVVRLPLAAKGFQESAWFWNTLPRPLIRDTALRPPIYIIASPEDRIISIEYADNKPHRKQVQGQIIIQAFGQYSENSCFETSQRIEQLLLAEQENNGNIFSINNDDFNYDEQVDITTRNVSYTLVYDL